MNSSCQEILEGGQFQLFGLVDPITTVSQIIHSLPKNSMQPPSATCKEEETEQFDLDLDLDDLPVALPYNYEPWSDAAIEKLRFCLLNCLGWLEHDQNYFSTEERREWLAWVAAPLRHERELNRTFDGPFSFQACCCAIGKDPEETRDQILEKHAPKTAKFIQAADARRVRMVADRIVWKVKRDRLTYL